MAEKEALITSWTMTMQIDANRPPAIPRTNFSTAEKSHSLLVTGAKLLCGAPNQIPRTIGLPGFHPGDTLCVYTDIERIGHSSMDIHIEAWVNRHLTHARVKVTEAKFIFVAVDEHGNSTPIEKPA